MMVLGKERKALVHVSETVLGPVLARSQPSSELLVRGLMTLILLYERQQVERWTNRSAVESGAAVEGKGPMMQRHSAAHLLAVWATCGDIL